MGGYTGVLRLKQSNSIIISRKIKFYTKNHSNFSEPIAKIRKGKIVNNKKMSKYIGVMLNTAELYWLD